MRWTKLGGVDPVEVDTSATYFDQDDENDNVQMGGHARMLRTVTTLSGSPVVLIACHPTKHATNDCMLPRGGGAFIAEVDGNLTCIKTGTVAEVHWQGKFRGCDFAPIGFQLETVYAPSLVDSKGRSIPTVMATPITEQMKEEIAGGELRRPGPDLAPYVAVSGEVDCRHGRGPKLVLRQRRRLPSPAHSAQVDALRRDNLLKDGARQAGAHRQRQEGG